MWGYFLLVLLTTTTQTRELNNDKQANIVPSSQTSTTQAQTHKQIKINDQQGGRKVDERKREFRCATFPT